MISIVLPTYNRATTLPRAVASVLRQSLTDWELIIVDDGSTDTTQQVLGDITDPRIRVCRHPANRGVSAAKNTGLDHIRGDWFTILDSDDEMVPDALAVMTEVAQSTGATAVTCNCVDSSTGQMTGIGLTRSGRVSAEDVAKCRGEFWGLTLTALLGGLRFDERLPGFESTVWLQIDRIARRYYVHRALRIYHTEGKDRLTATTRSMAVREKVKVLSALGEHRAYLRVMRETDCQRYARLMVRVWTARLLRPFYGRCCE